MNNKGFMMAEVVVVSAVIIVTLVSLYISYNKIFSIYNQRVSYNNITTLYELSYIRDNSMYLNAERDGKVDSGLPEGSFKDQNVNRSLYCINKLDLKTPSSIDTTGINKTFKDYIEYLSTSLDFDKKLKVNDKDYDWNKILLLEKCNKDNENDCTYAYLEMPVIPNTP